MGHVQLPSLCLSRATSQHRRAGTRVHGQVGTRGEEKQQDGLSFQGHPEKSTGIKSWEELRQREHEITQLSSCTQARNAEEAPEGREGTGPAGMKAAGRVAGSNHVANH